MKKEFSSLTDWKVGWWKKGKNFRYCYGLTWFGLTPMIKYKTKSNYLRGSRKSTAINPVCDKWFPNAEYIGTELKEVPE